MSSINICSMAHLDERQQFDFFIPDEATPDFASRVAPIWASAHMPMISSSWPTTASVIATNKPTNGSAESPAQTEAVAPARENTRITPMTHDPLAGGGTTGSRPHRAIQLHSSARPKECDGKNAQSRQPACRDSGRSDCRLPTSSLHPQSGRQPPHPCRGLSFRNRSSPASAAKKRPQKILGCEVWRGLDWLGPDDKVALDVSRYPNWQNVYTLVLIPRSQEAKTTHKPSPDAAKPMQPFTNPTKATAPAASVQWIFPLWL